MSTEDTNAKDALVVTTFSRRMTLELDGGERVSARIKGKRLRPVCGDRVHAESLPNEAEWLITQIAERRNALTRPNVRGEAEVLASNIDQLVVVVSALPRADWFIADRYIAAAEHMGAGSVVVFNKTDIEEPGDELGVYESLGYPVVATSVENDIGIDTLASLLAGKTSIFVGQSGVGKSSLINGLVESADQRVAEVSEKLEEGRHTTVNSALLRRCRHRLTRSPGLRAGLLQRRRHRRRLYRDHRRRRRLPVCQLPTFAGTGLRGKARRRGRPHRCPALRELPTTGVPDRETVGRPILNLPAIPATPRTTIAESCRDAQPSRPRPSARTHRQPAHGVRPLRTGVVRKTSRCR